MSVSLNEYEFYPKNPFMPRRTSPLPLNEKEEEFLKIYSAFATAMQNLVKSPSLGIDLQNKAFTSALDAAKYLREHPFSNKEGTEKLYDFLMDVSGKVMRTLIYKHYD